MSWPVLLFMVYAMATDFVAINFRFQCFMDLNGIFLVRASISMIQHKSMLGAGKCDS